MKSTYTPNLSHTIRDSVLVDIDTPSPAHARNLAGRRIDF